MADGDEKYPETDKKELAHRGAKAGLSVIPFLGGPIAELFALVVEPPLEIRRSEWLNSLASAVYELEDRVEDFSVENLVENPLFLSTLLHTTQTAMKNHQEEKIRILRNVIQNTALGNTPDESIHMIFLNYIDILTPWHMNLLTYFKEPQDWLRRNDKQIPTWSSGSIHQAIKHAFPELEGQRELCDALVTDLHNYHLLNIDGRGIHTMMTGHGVFGPRTTRLANQLIDFIKSPMDEL